MSAMTIVALKFALTGIAIITLLWALYALQKALRNHIKSSTQARTQATADAIIEQLKNGTCTHTPKEIRELNKTERPQQ